MRKAQVALFILMGMVVLVFGMLVFYLSDIMQARAGMRIVEASDAKQLVEYCLGVVAEDALLVIGSQGGFANLPITHFEPLKTAYLYDLGENNVPDPDAIAQELSDYINEHIGLCIGSFELLQKKGITVIERSQPRATALIGENEVTFLLDYDIEENKGGAVTKPEFLPAIKSVRLKKMVQLAKDIVESERKNSGLFDLDAECDLDVTHFPVEKTLVTVITDRNFLIQDLPYRFVFAHRR